MSSSQYRKMPLQPAGALTRKRRGTPSAPDNDFHREDFHYATKALRSLSQYPASAPCIRQRLRGGTRFPFPLSSPWWRGVADGKGQRARRWYVVKSDSMMLPSPCSPIPTLSSTAPRRHRHRTANTLQDGFPFPASRLSESGIVAGSIGFRHYLL